MKEKRILIVEDDSDLLEIWEEVLEEKGYVVLSARLVSEALRQIRTFDPDLILLDLNLPRVDGTAFLKLARQYLPKDTPVPPVVVMGAVCEHDIVEYVQQLGAADYLVKPFDTQRLLEIATRYAPMTPGSA